MKSGFWEKNFSLLIIYAVLMIVSFSFLRSEFRNLDQGKQTAESSTVQSEVSKKETSSYFVESSDSSDLLKESAEMDQFLRDWEKIVLEETLEDIRSNPKKDVPFMKNAPNLSSAANMNVQIVSPPVNESVLQSPVVKKSVVKEFTIARDAKIQAEEINAKDLLPFLHAYPKMESISSNTVSQRYRSRFGIRLKPLSSLKYNVSGNREPVDFFDVRYDADFRPKDNPHTDSVFTNVSMERPAERAIESPIVSPLDHSVVSSQNQSAGTDRSTPVAVEPSASPIFGKGSQSLIPGEVPIAEKYSLKEDGIRSDLPENRTKKESGSIALENEIWLISSERASSCNSGSQCLDFWRLTNGCWNNQTEETFFSGNGRFPATVVFIHGYLTDMQMAVQEGNLLQHRISSLQKKYNIDAPFRLVIWKWDSTKTFARIRKDALSKAVLANCDGQCIASLFSKMDKPERITLVGFSFGGRMAGSALQYLEEKGSESQLEYRMILLLAAADYADFSSVGRYAHGMQNLRALLNVYNPRDRVLRFYPKMYGHTGPQATGTAPIPCSVPLPEGNLSINMSGFGPEHKFSHGLYAIPDSSLIDFIFGIRENK